MQISRWVCQCGTVLARGRGLAPGRPAGPDVLRLGRELHTSEPHRTSAAKVFQFYLVAFIAVIVFYFVVVAPLQH